MKITLNGKIINTQQTTMDGLVNEQGYQDCVVATAINGRFIAVPERSQTPLSENCMVEIVAPMQGG